jgi:hypothetical protein
MTQSTPSTPYGIVVILLLLCFPQSTTAQAPATHFIELQVETGHVAEFLHAGLTEISGKLCPTSVDASWCGGQGPCFLHHVNVPEVGSIQLSTDPVTIELGGLGSFTGTKIRYAQPAEVFFKTQACIEDPSCPRTSFAGQQALTLNLLLGIKNKQLCLSVDETLTPPGVLPTGLDSERCFPIDLRAFNAVAAGKLSAGMIGLTVDPSETVLAIRREFVREGDNPPLSARQAAWSDFLSGTPAPAAHGGGWRGVVSAPLIQEAVQSILHDSIDDNPATPDTLDDPLPELTLDGPITTGWEPGLAPGGAVTANFSVVADIKPKCANPIGIDVDVELGFHQQGNLLLLDGTLAWDAHDEDVALCGLVWSLISPEAMPLVLTVAGAVAERYEPELGDLGHGCTDSVSTGQAQITCEFPVNLTSVQTPGTWKGVSSLFFNLGGVAANTMGPTLHGPAGVAPSPAPPAPDALAAGITMDYGLHGGCSTLRVGWESGLAVSGDRVCDVQILDDPLSVFDIDDDDVPTWEHTSLIDVIFPNPVSTLCPSPEGDGQAKCDPGEAPLDDYWQSPYPLKVSIWTPRASWSMVGPTPSEPTAIQVMAAQSKALKEEIECMSPQTGLAGVPGLYDPRWDIDPPHFVELKQPTGLERGERTIGRVALRDVRVRFRGSPTDTHGRLRTEAVPLVMEGVAMVDARGQGRFEVPFRTNLSTDWTVRTDAAGHMSALVSGDVTSQQVNLTSALPTSMAGAGFDVQFEPGALRIRGSR